MTSIKTEQNYYDDDGGVNVERRIQQKQEKIRRKKATKVKKSKPPKDQEDDEDGAMRQTERRTERVKPKKKQSIFTQCIPNFEEDEDGGIVLTFKRNIPSKNNSPKKSSVKTDDKVEDTNSSKQETSINQSNEPAINNETNTDLNTEENNPKSTQKEQPVSSKDKNNSPKRNRNSTMYSRSDSYRQAQGNISPVDTKVPIISNRNQTILANENPSEIASSAVKGSTSQDVTEMQRRKLVRNRWYVAYTLIRNPRLFQLRKQFEERLMHIYSQTRRPITIRSSTIAHGSQSSNRAVQETRDETHLVNRTNSNVIQLSPAEKHVINLSLMLQVANLNDRNSPT